MAIFLFFKQKTAYEMRISDWSSDVCSSDLWKVLEYQSLGLPVWIGEWHQAQGYSVADYDWVWAWTGGVWNNLFCRSEEHTSELQSLMRNSYAVFCLKKKREQTKDKLISILRYTK